MQTKYSVLIIFCKTIFTQSLEPSSNVSIHYHWIGQQITNMKMLYIELWQNVTLLPEGLIVCFCLPPDRAWHKVNDPKVNYSRGWGRSGSSQDSNPAWLYLSSLPTRRWPNWSQEPFSFESVLDFEHRAELKPGWGCMYFSIFKVLFFPLLLFSPNSEKFQV